MGNFSLMKLDMVMISALCYTELDQQGDKSWISRT
jgi:hypothetical protein